MELKELNKKTVGELIAMLDQAKKIEEDKIYLESEASQALLTLYNLKKYTEYVNDETKRKLKEVAEKLNPLFTGIKSDYLTLRYSSYGSKYGIDESKIESIPVNLYKRSYMPIAEEIDKYQDENKSVPDGILTVERENQITFSPKKEYRVDYEL